jgi:hypothetical protein
MANIYLRDNQKALCLLIAPLVSFGHCIVRPSIYGFGLPLCYILAIVLSPTSIYAFWLPHTLAKRYQMGNQKAYIKVGQTIHWPRDNKGVIRRLPLWYLVAIVSSVLLRLMPSDYHFGIIWSLYRLSYFVQLAKDTKGVIRRHKSK